MLGKVSAIPAEFNWAGLLRLDGIGNWVGGMGAHPSLVLD